MFPPLPTHVHSYVDGQGKPSSVFFDYLKRERDHLATLENQVTALRSFVAGMTTPIAVASLPSPSPAGQRRICNDVLPPLTFAATFVGGSTNTVPVYSDGITWRLG